MLRRSFIMTRFYVTEVLEQHGFAHNFPNIVKRANIPHDTQRSGSCFCLAPVVMRRILSKLEPKKYGTRGSKKNAEEFLSENFGIKPKSGQPGKAFERLIGDPRCAEITDKELKIIPEHCSHWPVIVPYCPAPDAGLFVKMDLERYINDVHAIASNMDYSNKPQKIHAMCAAGIIVDETDRLYFVCAQTWDNCKVVLVPIVTNEEYAKRYPMGSILGNIFRLNVYYKHTHWGTIPEIPLPPRLPLTYHQAFCIPPIVNMPLVG